MQTEIRIMDLCLNFTAEGADYAPAQVSHMDGAFLFSVIVPALMGVTKLMRKSGQSSRRSHGYPHSELSGCGTSCVEMIIRYGHVIFTCRHL